MPRPKLFDEAEVLQKAMLLFWKKGYFDTSIKDLIEFLGISNASLYHSFGGKRKLFDQAFALYQRSNLHGMAQFLATQQDVRTGLRGIFEKIITDDFADPDCKGCFIVNSTAELIPEDDSFKAVVAEHQQRVEEIFVGYLDRGKAAGQIAPDLDLPTIANLLYIQMTGLRVVGKAKADPEQSRKSVETILQLLG